jgi:hypothetical protein
MMRYPPSAIANDMAADSQRSLRRLWKSRSDGGGT